MFMTNMKDEYEDTASTELVTIKTWRHGAWLDEGQNFVLNNWKTLVQLCAEFFLVIIGPTIFLCSVCFQERGKAVITGDFSRTHRGWRRRDEGRGGSGGLESGEHSETKRNGRKRRYRMRGLLLWKWMNTCLWQGLPLKMTALSVSLTTFICIRAL